MTALHAWLAFFSPQDDLPRFINLCWSWLQKLDLADAIPGICHESRTVRLENEVSKPG
jgi:hypothetical protein